MKRAGFIQASAAVVLALLAALLRTATVVKESNPTPERPMLAQTLELSEPIPKRAGFLSDGMDLSHLTADKIPASLAGVNIPAQWDWRAQGKVSPVRNQGTCGSCYAFSTVGGLESRLLIDNAGLSNLSESNAKECNWWEATGYESPPGYPRGSCDGGSPRMVANLFSQKGTVNETCDPYVATDVSCKETCPYQQTLLGWSQIAGPSVPDTEVLKAYIMEFGPVTTALYTGSGDAWETEFHNYTGSHTLFYPGLETPNHGVLIVGWNDNLPHVGGTGGWIVKNSWGPYWGGSCGHGHEAGYFTIAYGSASIGWYASVAYDWQEYDPAGDLLYYDDAGWTSALGYSGGTSAWGLTRFTPPESGFATRVEFWTVDLTSDVDLYIYDDFDGRSTGQLLWNSVNLSYDSAGYHGVAIEPPLAIYAGDEVVVVAKLTNADATCPVAVDSQGQHEVGRTYVSSSGNSRTWLDVGVEMGVDVALRLRTTGHAYVPTPEPSARLFVPLLLVGARSP
jgi:C1A family cysteine protease